MSEPRPETAARAGRNSSLRDRWAKLERGTKNERVLLRAESFVAGTAGKRLTYKAYIQ